MPPHQREREQGRLLIEAEAALRHLIHAVESELPGDMPDEMWEALRNDRDAMLFALREAVRQTKHPQFFKPKNIN